MKTKLRWSVRLGAHEWAKHTYERSADDPLRLLGRARKGQQSGALAKLGDAFVLVVGDHVTPLGQADNKELAAAAAHAKPDEGTFACAPAPVAAKVAPTVVIIKRRRIPAPH